jgi:DNA-nicking Smr family endonuclease
MRRLTAQERALWARVAATITPLPGRRSPAPPAEPACPPAPAAAPTTPPASTRPTARPPAPPARATPQSALNAPLDGGWDRQISRGRLEPDQIIDLHGHSVAQAHARLGAAITAGNGARVLLVITGKGRPDRPSRIRAELLDWLAGWPAAVASVRVAHPRHGGSGAFYVILRRPRALSAIPVKSPGRAR